MLGRRVCTGWSTSVRSDPYVARETKTPIVKGWGLYFFPFESYISIENFLMESHGKQALLFLVGQDPTGSDF